MRGEGGDANEDKGIDLKPNWQQMAEGRVSFYRSKKNKTKTNIEGDTESASCDRLPTNDISARIKERG